MDQQVQTGSVFDNQSVKITINDTVFQMRPLKLGAAYKLISIVDQGMTDMARSGGDVTLSGLAKVFFSRLNEIIKILIPNNILTDEFIKQNVDLVTGRAILEQAVKLNRLEDLYPLLKKLMSKGGASSTTKTGV